VRSAKGDRGVEARRVPGRLDQPQGWDLGLGRRRRSESCEVLIHRLRRTICVICGCSSSHLQGGLRLAYSNPATKVRPSRTQSQLSCLPTRY
jgi:hypothetical protein